MMVPVEGSDPPKMIRKLTPCSPGDPAAQEKTWADVSSDELLEPPLYVFFVSSLSQKRVQRT